MKSHNTHIKAGLIIPVFNVEKTFRKVLEAITPEVLEQISEILIIDNHSNDQTVAIIQDYMKNNPSFAHRVSLIIHEENYGYGCSIKTGFEYFSNRPVTHVMVIHGDYQIDPDWLMGKLLESIQNDPNLDFVLASRFKSESNLDNYSLLRKLGNYFFNVTTFLCTGLRMSDSGTAMIIVRRSSLTAVSFANLSNSWQFHPQLNILLYSLPGIRIKEIPMDWADSEAPSTVPLFLYGWILLKMLLGYRFKKSVLKKNPQEIFPIHPLRSDRKFIKIDFREK
jgi:glycosyltransferase involved in cell wall biosynthesis